MCKILLSLVIALFALSGMGRAQTIITSFPHHEGFEGGAVPDGWTEEQITGTAGWEIATAGGYNGLPNTVHAGTYKARFRANGSVAKTRLSTPPIDLTGVATPWLKFWHTQRVSGSFQDVLRVYYKTSANGEWVLLEEYTTDVFDWTERIILLPNPSADYYIGFEGEVTSLVGNSVQLDDVVVEAAAAIDINGSATELAFGDVYSNLPVDYSQRMYIIRNSGIEAMEVTLGSASPEITVEGLPVTVGSMSADTVIVKLNAATLRTGGYTGSFTLVSGDEDTPELTVTASANILFTTVNSFIDENFSDPDKMSATGWKWTYQGGGAFPRQISGGIDNSACMRADLQYGTTPAFLPYMQAEIRTGYVEMGPEPEISFHYKATAYRYQQPGNPYSPLITEPATAEALAYAKAWISTDGLNWDEFVVVAHGEHIPSADFALVEVSGDLSMYAGQICLIRFQFGVAEGNMYLDLDDVKAGSVRVNELSAVSVSGNSAPVALRNETYTVSVTSFGTAVQENYTVKLMQEGVGEIASVQGTAISQYETKSFEIEWTPVKDTVTYIYGEVELNGDEYTGNNKTSVFRADVQPSTFTGVTIGTGTTGREWMPYNTYFRKSLTQSLYYPDEFITNGGEIHTLIYRADFLIGSSVLQNVPVQIWIGETDVESLESGWVNPSTLTEVFNGTLNLSAEGNFDVTVPLTTPYEYNGGILVVYSYRKDTEIGAVGSYFVCTAYPDSYRSRVYYTDTETIDPSTPPSIEPYSPANTEKHGIPNTTFMMNLENTGSLSGTVSGTGSALLNNATVAVKGTALSAVTDTEGKYLFPYIKPGDYEIEVNRTGYETKTANITIATQNETVQDVTMDEKPHFTVSGKVTGSNAPNGLEGAAVTILGYNNYSTATDASGNYAIQGVYSGYSYSIEIKIRGYAVYTSTVTVAGTDVTGFDVRLNEYTYPVLNPSAVPDGTGVAVSWEAPGGTSLFSYDNDTLTGHLGFRDILGNIVPFPNGIMGSVHRTGAALTSMSWCLADYYYTDATEVNLFVFELDADGMPTSEVIYSALNVASTRMEWNTHEFPEPVEAPNGFYIAISHPEKFLSIGTSTPNGEHPFMEQTHFFSTDYTSQGFTPFETASLNAIVMIRAEGISMGKSVQFGHFEKSASKTFGAITTVGNPALTPAVTPLAVPQSVSDAKMSAPVGYTVYRLTEGQTDETAWDELSTVTETSFTDTGWTELPAGTYQYAIKAKYEGENLSKAALTNTLSNVHTITVSATPEAGGTVTGGGDYTTGTSITVTATPAANYTFVNWTENGNSVSANAEYTFTVTGDRTLVANFALEQFEVTFNTPEHGTLTVTAGSETVANGSMVNYNTELVITATPDEGYKPESLTVNGTDFNSGDTHTVTGNVNIECKFTQDVGIDDNTLSGIHLYPNPFTYEIMVSNPAAVRNIQITNAAGQKVKEVALSSKTISTGELSGGVYFVTVETVTGEKAVYKMVKK